MEERQKIKNNIIKLSHSIVVSGLSSAYLYESNLFIKNLIFFISSTYFYYDSKLLLKCDKIDYPMLYHHIIALLLLFGFYIDYYGYVLIYLYNLGELSNIPMYITYHLRKTSPNMNLILCSNVLQTLVYGYFRVYKMTNYLIKNTYLIYTPLAPLLGIYLMGLFWFFALCKQIYDERITIRYIILDSYNKLLQS
jgi:hypothetical protein